MDFEKIGWYLETRDEVEHFFCLEHQPDDEALSVYGKELPVWEGGLGGAMACEICGRRLDGVPQSAAAASDLDREVSRRLDERYD